MNDGCIDMSIDRLSMYLSMYVCVDVPMCLCIYGSLFFGYLFCGVMFFVFSVVFVLVLCLL